MLFSDTLRQDSRSPTGPPEPGVQVHAQGYVTRLGPDYGCLRFLEHDACYLVALAVVGTIPYTTMHIHSSHDIIKPRPCPRLWNEPALTSDQTKAEHY